MRTCWVVTTVLLLAYAAVAKVHLDSDVLRPIKGDGDDVLYFWHITDPHLDLNYTVGSNPNCGIPLCCRSKEGLNETSPRAGKFGYRGKCDIPVSVFQSALEFIAAYPVKSLFLNYGGDNLAHDDWSYTKDLNLKYMHLVHDMLRVMIGKNTTVLSVIGNHDGYPIDQFDTPPGSSWYLDAWGEAMSYWLPEEIVSQLKYAGYHTFPLRKGLKAIVLNTQYYDRLNFWLYKNSSAVDFAGQIAFLEKELQLSAENNEKVIVMGHIPPEGQMTKQIDMYEALYKKYGKIIIAHLYGHHHCDYFVTYSDSENPKIANSVSYVGPVLTTYQRSNPAIRMFKMNATTYDLIDSVVFFVNLTVANESGELKWEHLYSAKEAYKLKDLSANSWLDLAHRMKTDDELFNLFDNYYYAGGEPNCGMDDAKCRKNTICESIWMTDAEIKACKQA